LLVTPAVLPDAVSAFLVSAAPAGVDGIMLLTTVTCTITAVSVGFGIYLFTIT
jgi:hypothetical protein